MAGGKLWSNTAKIMGSSVFLDASTVGPVKTSQPFIDPELLEADPTWAQRFGKCRESMTGSFPSRKMWTTIGDHQRSSAKTEY